MTLAKSDPLLRAATILINFTMVVLAAATVILLILVPIVFLTPDRLVNAGGMSLQIVSIPGPGIILPLAVVLLALAFLFFIQLRRIVVSVGGGNSFTTINADRLRNMAWLALIMQVIEIFMGLIAYWAIDQKEPGSIDLPVSSLTGILIALVLFILARVFRVGSAMREELEGTI